MLNKTVFILGAGTSTDAGIPTLWSMTDLVALEHKLSCLTDLKFNKYSTAGEYDKAIAENRKLIRLIEKKTEVKKDFDKFYSKLSEKNRRLVSSIYFWFFWDKRNNSAKVTQRFRSTRPLQLFARYIKKNRIKNVISFNYDIMLEEAIRFVSNSKFPYNYNEINNSGNRKLSILKPMGSVNWILGKKGEEDLFNNYKIRKLKDVSEKDFLYETLIYFRAIHRAIFNPSVYLRPEHFLVLPEVWDQTLKAIEWAENLIVAGYNLKRISNKNISLQLSKTLKTILLKYKLCVIDKEIKLKRFIKNFRKKNKQYHPFDFCKQSFAEWVSHECDGFDINTN